MQDRETRVRLFLSRLTELSNELGIAIDGCGCCDSPYFIDIGSTRIKYQYDLDIGKGSARLTGTPDKYFDTVCRILSPRKDDATKP